MPAPFNNRVIQPVEMVLTPQLRAADSGDYFVGQIVRTGVAVANTFAWLVTAPIDRELVIDAINPTFDVTGLATGTLFYKTELYLRDSARNDYVYTGGSAAASFGTSTNGNFINKQSASKLNAGGTTPTLTGVSDFVANDANILMEVAGKLNSQSGTSQSPLFTNGRVIVIPAGSTLLARTVSSGTATGTYSIDTMVSFFERQL